MRKFIVFTLILIFILIPFTVSAETDYAEKLSWIKEYETSLNSTEPFFKNVTSNALNPLDKSRIPLKKQWTEFSVDITATRQQIYSPQTVKPLNIFTPSPAPTPTPSPTPDWKEQPIMSDLTEMVTAATKTSLLIILFVGAIYLGITYSLKKKK